MKNIIINPSSYNVSFHYFATDRIAIQVRLTWPFYNLIDYGFSIGYYAIKINNVSKAYFLVGCSQTEENYYARDTTDNKYFRGILRHFGLNFGLGFLLDGFEANQFGFLEGGFRYGLHKSISYPMPVQSQLLPNIESIDVCTFVQEGYTWSINK
jgi:hypothetical protein